MVDLELARELELDCFKKDLNNIEEYYLNLIYNPLLDEVQERWEYEKTASMIEWKCAICDCDILVDKERDDVENFVCENCREVHNKTNETIDVRVLKSRNKLYKYLENRLYEELEDTLKGGR